MKWCQGKPEYPGIKKRVFFISTSVITKWPQYTVDSLGRPTSASPTGSFTLAEGEKWKCIDHLPAKATVRSETQGEAPSQTFKNTVEIVHPGVGPDATDAASLLLNDQLVFLVEDMRGDFRLIGSEKYQDAVAEVKQDLGQGATGTTGTTITLTSSDIVSLPVYKGEIVTEDGTINEDTTP